MFVYFERADSSGNRHIINNKEAQYPTPLESGGGCNPYYANVLKTYNIRFTYYIYVFDFQIVST